MKQKKVVEGTIGEYTLALEGLLPNQKYTYCAYAVNPTGTYYGEVKVFTTTASKPSVSSPVASSITSTSATLSAAVKSHGGETVSEVGFYYGTDPSVDTETSSKVSSLYSQDAFSIEVSDLTVNTKYYVKSYAKNAVGVTFSAAESFMTSVSSPSVKTVGSSEVTSTSVTLSGLVVSDNGAAITERGFVWLQGSGIPTTESYRLKVDGNTGEFTGTVTGLDPGEKYSFRAYAINPKGTSYGEIMNFTTVAGLPVLSATRITDVKTTSAVFTSTVTSHGGATVSEVGFYYSTDENVDVATAVKVSETYSTDSFTLQINDLEVGTEYYVKSYAKNSAGEDYGAVAYFKTVSTAPSVITSGASKLTATSAELSGEVADDNGETITDRGFVWIIGTGTPSTSSGNRIQVIGTTGEFSATLEDLEPNQTYSFRAYAVNSKGTSYGETLTFKTDVALPVVEFTGCSAVTSSSAVVSGKVTDHGGETVSETGFLYGTTPVLDPSAASRVKSAYNGDSFSFTLSGLTRAQNYYVQPFATNSKGTSYGDVTMFTTLPSLPIVTTNDVTAITDNSAMSGGVIVDDGGSEILGKGVVWSKIMYPMIEFPTRTENGTGDLPFESEMSDLSSGTTYFYRAYAINSVGISYGEQKSFTTIGDIKAISLESSNSFIVSKADIYSFKAVKGNSSESVGDVATVEVLWESFGTDEVPEKGSLISSVSYSNSKIGFEVPEPYREGNAVIAAKDADGIILWSWHIWLTDEPEEQVYNNNAGTMMDRNLGATSATPGDVGALGLMYQWGRKDPFLNSSTILDTGEAAQSTITWPRFVYSDSTTGTIEYSIKNPTTFIAYSDGSNADWYYTGSDSTDKTRWQSEKTIYDPCPAGWRVPDGGDSGVWATALGSSSSYYKAYDRINKGMNFSGELGTYDNIWYPASGWRSNNNVIDYATQVGYSGYYWSVNEYNDIDHIGENCIMYLSKDDYTGGWSRLNADGISVRCFKEGTGEDIPEGDNETAAGEHKIWAYDTEFLSDNGAANSYIVSESGTYSISAVKGNSSELVDPVSRVEVLWESFGTDVAPFKGDLVKAALYEDGKIYFKTADAFKEGNAVIAAKDASSHILWSWHIWLTDEPEGQVYYNNAGTMMDRNLGATSATSGDVGALGLLYQWGRKDPFLSGCSIDSYDQVAKSTLTWPSAVSSDSWYGTIDYAIEHPTTFIKYNSNNDDWYYTGSSSTDDTRWQSDKTIYDPCPVGWRVPDGGDNGVWSTALGSSSDFYDDSLYDNTNAGMNFSGRFGSSSTIWYPASGYRRDSDGALYNVDFAGFYWSVSPHSSSAYYLYFDGIGYFLPSSYYNRASGLSVRCLQE